MPLRTMMATLPGAEGNNPPAGRSGGSAGDAKRRERAARKLEQQETEAAAGIDDGSSIMTLKYSFQEPVGDIHITEDWSGDGNGLAGLQWPGGVVLSRYMDCRQAFPEDHFVGRRVIEVGAGCGLTSIYTALRGADVTITDMDPAKCADNVDMNLDPRGLSGKASVRRLEWDCAAELALFEPPYDIVIAGDCLYEEACISPLLKTMWALSGPNTEVLLSGVVGHSVLASFLGQARQYFELETVDTSKIDTLAEELPLGNLSDAAAVEAALARARATAEPTGLDPDAAARSVAERGPEEENKAGGGVGGPQAKAALGGKGVESELAAVAQLPGQRALMRLRKKCDAGAGE
ncbi:unnamed protein product [Ectocarpus sp. 6 AP-2014]